MKAFPVTYSPLAYGSPRMSMTSPVVMSGLILASGLSGGTGAASGAAGGGLGRRAPGVAAGEEAQERDAGQASDANRRRPFVIHDSSPRQSASGAYAPPAA